MPWSRRLQRNERLTHTLLSFLRTHTHTHSEEEWQITAAATVHAWTCVSNVKSRLLLIHVSVFFSSLSQSVLSWSEVIFQTSFSLFSPLFYFLVVNSSVSFSIYLLSPPLSLSLSVFLCFGSCADCYRRALQLSLSLSRSLSLSLSPPSVSHSLLDSRLLWVETGQR